MFSYFENRKTTYFDVFCLNYSIETKIKTLFLISYFDLSKKTEMALWVHGLYIFLLLLPLSRSSLKRTCTTQAQLPVIYVSIFQNLTWKVLLQNKASHPSTTSVC